jgi:hypothetical protein
MPLVPFLKLQARLEGLPVEQLDMHMARQLAEELGQSYQAVSRGGYAVVARKADRSRQPSSGRHAWTCSLDKARVAELLTGEDEDGRHTPEQLVGEST